MKNFIIGVAGARKHGKTTLIKALTGIDTENLSRDKRNLTLDSGYAYMELPRGNMAGLVELQDREKFMTNSLAGIGGLDIILLLVEADRGITDSLREQVELLDLLNLQGGIVTITKTDLSSPEMIVKLREDLQSLQKHTFLRNAPIIETSAGTGKGIDDLAMAMDRASSLLKTKDEDGPVRIPIDRVFKRSGFGIVVTGTIYQGSIKTDKNIQLLPDSRKGRIRRIQSSGRELESAVAGQRVALNLSRIGMENLIRGKQILSPGAFRETNSLDASITVIKSCPEPLKHLDDFRLFLATQETPGKIILLDSEKVEPGCKAFARLVLSSHVVAQPGDPILLRPVSGEYAIGAGKILEAHPSYHRRFDSNSIETLKLKELEDHGPLLEKILQNEPYCIFNLETLSVAASLPCDKTAELVKALKIKGKAYEPTPGSFVSSKVIRELGDKVLKIVELYLKSRPESPGIRPEEIKINMHSPDDALFRVVLEHLKSVDKISEKNGLVSVPGHQPVIQGHRAQCRAWIMEAVEKSGFEPPTKAELEEDDLFPETVTRQIIGYLIHNGELVDLDGNILLTPAQISRAKNILGAYIYKNGPLKPSVARDLLGASRKYIIPILEYFDRTYFTLRQKDGRVLVKKDIIPDSSGD